MKLIFVYLLILKLIDAQDTRIKGGCGVKPHEAPWLVFIRNGGTEGDCPEAPSDKQIEKQIEKSKPPKAVTETPQMAPIAPPPCAGVDAYNNPCSHTDPLTNEKTHPDLNECHHELNTVDCVPHGSDLNKDGFKSCPAPCEHCWLRICSHKKPGTNEKEYPQLDDCPEQSTQTDCKSIELENQLLMNQKLNVKVCPSIDQSGNYCSEKDDKTGEKYQPELPDCPNDLDEIPNCVPSGSEADAQGLAPVCPEPLPEGGLCTPNITGTGTWINFYT